MAKVAVYTSTLLLMSVLVGTVSAQSPPGASTARQAESTTIEELIAQAEAELDAEAAAQDQAPVQTAVAKQRGSNKTAPAFAENDSVIFTSDNESLILASSQEPLPGPDPADPEPIDPDPQSAAPIADDEGPVFLYEDGTPMSGGVWSMWDACCRSGFYAGAEGTFLAPFSEPLATVYLTNLVTNAQWVATAQPGFGAGIRSWLGFQNNGWGIRARHWHFGNDAISVDPVVPVGAFPTVQGAYHLDADVVDIELTQRFCFFGNCQIDTAFGARYAQLDRNATALAYGDVGDPNNGVSLLGLAMGANEIEGVGFTTSVGGRKPLFMHWPHRCNTCAGPCVERCGCFCGRWLGFWNIRGGLLWADSTVSTLTDANAVTKGVAIAQANSRNKASASKDHNQNVGIIEVQLGIEYQHQFRCCPAIGFIRFGAEYQHWETGDVFAESNSFAFLQGTQPAFGGRTDSLAVAHDGDLDLIGFFIGGGITY